MRICRPKKPRIEKIHTAGLLPADMTLCVTDTRGSHSELTGEFAAIRHEMESVAACLGGKVLGQVKEQEFWTALPRLRRACGDRAVLRAVHYFEENARALAQRNALVSGDFNAFLQLILESGHASFALCQNVYCSTDVRHQGLSVALASVRLCLRGRGEPGGCRAAALQGPFRRLYRYADGKISRRDRKGVRCGQLLSAPSAGAGGPAGHLNIWIRPNKKSFTLRQKPEL